MAGIGSVVVQFGAVAGSAMADATRFANKLDGIGKAADRSRRDVGRMSGALKAGLAVGAVAAGAGVLGLAGALIEMGKEAVDDARSAAALRDVLDRIPGVSKAAAAGIEAWVTQMQLATNIADTDLRKAVGRLTLATNDLSAAQRLAAAAADLATVAGKPFAAVAEAMAKAANGNTTALKRMAPWLDTNKDGTLTLSEALKKLEGRFKTAAEEAANRDPWTRIQVIWGELRESLGSFLIPLLEELSDWMSSKKNIKALQNFIDKTGEMSLAVGKSLAPVLKDLLKWLSNKDNQKGLKDFADNVINASAAVGPLISDIVKLLGWLEKLRKLNLDGLKAHFGQLPWRGAPQPSSMSTPSGAATFHRQGSIVINSLTYHGTGNVTADAHTLRDLLERGDLEQGRPAGAPKRVAW